MLAAGGPCRQPGSGSRQPSGCRQPGSGSCQPSGCGPGWPGRPWKRGPWQNSHVGGGGTEYVGWWRRGGGQSIYVGQGPAVVYPCLCVAGSRLRRLTAPTQPLSDRLPARPELLRGRRWQYVGWWRDGWPTGCRHGQNSHVGGGGSTWGGGPCTAQGAGHRSMHLPSGQLPAPTAGTAATGR